MTAASALAAYEALRDARAARKNYRTVHREKRDARDEAVAKLKKHLRWVIQDLKMNLPAGDSRWQRGD